MQVMRRLILLTVIAVLALAGPASAVESAQVLVHLNADGTGALTANSQSDPPGETWSWDECSATGTGCGPFATGQTIPTTGANPNTTFAAIASDGPTATSPVWGGNLSASSPPSVSGAVRANALVTPVDGGWTGGWPADFDQTQLAACIDAQGTQCTTLTDTHFLGGCPNAAAVIDPAFAGRYLRVADHVVGPNESTADFALSSPYTANIWAADARTSVAMVGLIAPATGPPAAACAVPLPAGVAPPISPGTSPPVTPATSPPPPPTPPANAGPPAAKREPSATATLTATGAARVHAIAACSITLRATRGRRHVNIRRTVAASQTVTMRLSPRVLRALGSGRTIFSVWVNGISRTTRVITLARPAGTRSATGR